MGNCNTKKRLIAAKMTDLFTITNNAGNKNPQMLRERNLLI